MVCATNISTISTRDDRVLQLSSTRMGYMEHEAEKNTKAKSRLHGEKYRAVGKTAVPGTAVESNSTHTSLTEQVYIPLNTFCKITVMSSGPFYLAQKSMVPITQSIMSNPSDMAFQGSLQSSSRLPSQPTPSSFSSYFSPT